MPSMGWDDPATPTCPCPQGGDDSEGPRFLWAGVQSTGPSESCPEGTARTCPISQQAPLAAGEEGAGEAGAGEGGAGPGAGQHGRPARPTRALRREVWPPGLPWVGTGLRLRLMLGPVPVRRHRACRGGGELPVAGGNLVRTCCQGGDSRRWDCAWVPLHSPSPVCTHQCPWGCAVWPQGGPPSLGLQQPPQTAPPPWAVLAWHPVLLPISPSRSRGRLPGLAPTACPGS